MTPTRSLLDDLVARGVDDWVYDAELLDIAAQHGADEPGDRLTVALGLAAQALIAGLVEAGTVSNDGFVAWNCTGVLALERIGRQWISLADPLVMLGEIVWLRNTPQGDAAGQAVLARERA